MIARPLRTLDGVEVALPDGVTAVLGENGSGKTNLLEAALLRSHRPLLSHLGPARADPLLRADRPRRGTGSRRRRHRAPLPGLGQPRRRAPPSARRQRRRRRHRGAQPPSRGGLLPGPAGSGQGPAGGAPRPPRPLRRDPLALARRPAPALRAGTRAAQRAPPAGRSRCGRRGADLESWDATLAEAATALDRLARARRSPSWRRISAEAADELGFDAPASIAYAPRAEGDAEELRAGLEERREADLRLGRTSWGPHLDEVRISLGDRPLRRYGSQGQQRLALLALLFAERESLLRSRGAPPLMLLDDVMSELDRPRRERLCRAARGRRAGADHRDRGERGPPRARGERRSGCRPRPAGRRSWRPDGAARPPPRRGGDPPRPRARRAAEHGLAAVQAVWAEVVGPAVAAASEPSSRAQRHGGRPLRERRLGRGAGDDGRAAAGPLRERLGARSPSGLRFETGPGWPASH